MMYPTGMRVKIPALDGEKAFQVICECINLKIHAKQQDTGN